MTIIIRKTDDRLLTNLYSFLIGGEGTVFEGRGWHTISSRKKTVKCIDPEFPTQYEVHSKYNEKEAAKRQIVIGLMGEEDSKLYITFQYI